MQLYLNIFILLTNVISNVVYENLGFNKLLMIVVYTVQ